MSELDHKQALAAINADDMRRLTQLSDSPGLIRLTSHLAAILLCGAFVGATTGLTQVGAQALLGLVLVFLFAPLHECIHRTAFRTRWLNDVVAEICGFLLLLPPRSFRFFHFAHHRHTQDPERDPELSSPKPETWPAYLWRLTGWSYWVGQVRGMITAAVGGEMPDFVPERAVARVRWEARAYLALYLAAACFTIMSGHTALVTFWILPLLLGQPWLRAYLLAEHTACPLNPDMLANTRTTFANRFVRWFAWEMPHHTAHHALPQAPFHKLPSLTEELRPYLRSTAYGYPDAHRQIVARFRT
ncbi:MAG: fatty acid desaturase [Pseudomonadota bacterium]